MVQIRGILLGIVWAHEYYNFFIFYENPLKHGCWIYQETMVPADNGGYDHPDRYSV
jgi:hypothetical protein